VPARDFLTGPYETALAADELLVEIRVPIRPKRQRLPEGGTAGRRLGGGRRRRGTRTGRRHGARCRDRTDRGRRRAGASPREAEDFLRGGPATEERFAEAALIAAAHCSPVADQRGPVDYKRHLAGELTTRALRAARRAGPWPGGLTMRIAVNVNGEDHESDVEPRLLLVHYLRDDLGLTGTHWGCDTSNCGTCVVWLDETPVKSCTVLAVMADGHRGPHRRGHGRAWRARSGPKRISPSVTDCSAVSSARRA